MESKNNANEFLNRMASTTGAAETIHQEVGGESSTRKTDLDALEFEQRIAEIWKEILDLPAVDIDTDFFELGGDSIQAVQILYQIRVQLDRELSLVELLQDTLTVRSMAAKLRELPSSAA